MSLDVCKDMLISLPYDMWRVRLHKIQGEFTFTYSNISIDLFYDSTTLRETYVYGMCVNKKGTTFCLTRCLSSFISS